jgi:hypothetical protein
LNPLGHCSFAAGTPHRRVGWRVSGQQDEWKLRMFLIGWPHDASWRWMAVLGTNVRSSTVRCFGATAAAIPCRGAALALEACVWAPRTLMRRQAGVSASGPFMARLTTTTPPAAATECGAGSAGGYVAVSRETRPTSGGSGLAGHLTARAECFLPPDDSLYIHCVTFCPVQRNTLMNGKGSRPFSPSNVREGRIAAA